jgi:hypothetical protein
MKTPAITCSVKEDLVNQLIDLNCKVNSLSPNWLQSAEARAEVQQRREFVYAEIKRHRTKGHEGKPCPAAQKYSW